jgi:hypothetical protein
MSHDLGAAVLIPKNGVGYTGYNPISETLIGVQMALGLLWFIHYSSGSYSTIPALSACDSFVPSNEGLAEGSRWSKLFGTKRAMWIRVLHL